MKNHHAHTQNALNMNALFTVLDDEFDADNASALNLCVENGLWADAMLDEADLEF